MDCEDVLTWLKEAYPEYGLKIQEIKIPSVLAPAKRSKKKFELFQMGLVSINSIGMQ